MTMPSIHIATITNLAACSGQALRIKHLVTHIARKRPVSLFAPAPLDLPAIHIDQFSWQHAVRGDQFNGRSFGLGGLRRTYQISKALRRFLADARLVYTDVPLILLYTAVGARHIAGVIEVNGIYSEEWVTKGYLNSRRDIRYHIMRALEGQALRSAQAVIAVSAGLRDYLIHEFRVRPDRIHVIPNGIDMAAMTSAPQATALPDGPTAIFVGSFRPWHGVHNLIHALPHMLARAPSLKLVLVGDGPTRAECEALARKLDVEQAAVFVGQQTPESVSSYVAAARVCLYYPDYNIDRYGFMGDPIKLREYMAMGKPVVTVKLPNFAEMIEQTGCGLVVEAGHQRFGEAVAELVGNPERAIELGRRGRQAVEDRYDWSDIADRILDVIDHTAQKQTTRAN